MIDGLVDDLVVRDPTGQCPLRFGDTPVQYKATRIWRGVYCVEYYYDLFSADTMDVGIARWSQLVHPVGQSDIKTN